MLRRASVDDVQKGRVSREKEILVVVMRHYPRFLKRELVDEYVRALAPDPELFSEFKATARKLKNHNAAFDQSRYENRFELAPEGMVKLGELSELAREKDVILICQCRDYERCHADLLLQLARHHFDAPVAGLLFEYPEFQQRLG